MYSNSYYFSLILIFSIISYIIIADRNVSDYIELTFKIIKVNMERAFWMIKLHPKNPITNYFMKKQYEKIAKELHKELIRPPLD
jgi:hypothetical protein